MRTSCIHCATLPDASFTPTMLRQSLARLTTTSGEMLMPVRPGTLYKSIGLSTLSAKALKWAYTPRWLDARKEWNDLVGQISVRKDGNLVLVPREGAERFLFGTPTGIDAKFGRIRKYYESIAPTRETPYKTVDVRFDGQIICRNK